MTRGAAKDASRPVPGYVRQSKLPARPGPSYAVAYPIS